MLILFILVQIIFANTGLCESDTNGSYAEGFLIYGIISTVIGWTWIVNIFTLYSIPAQILGLGGYLGYWIYMYEGFLLCGTEAAKDLYNM